MNTTRLPLTAADYIVVLGYFLLVLWIGLWFRRRMANVGDYFAGGNQIPWWMAGISHYMSSFSAFSFIAYAQIGYLYGWVAVTLFWVSIPGCLGGAIWFARRWRRARVVTPIAFLEERYNGTLRQTFAWAGIPMKIFDDALKVFATGVFVSLATGLNLIWSIAVCGVGMIVYTAFGGLWALVLTDYIQFLMKGLAILLMVPLALRATGGLRAGLANLPSGFLAPVHQPYGWMYLLGFAVVMFVSYNASWSLAQKYYSVPNERDAVKAAYLSAALNFVGAPLMILPAILSRHFLPDLIASNRTADTYVLLVGRLLPEGMVGIVLAAMFSATMAAVSSDFNAIASVLTEDVFHRIFAQDATPRALLRVGRQITVLLGAITTLLSLWIAYSHRQSLFSLMVTVFGVFLAPTLLPLLLGLVARWVSAGGALTGFCAGFSCGGIMLLLTRFWPASSTLLGSPNAWEGLSLMCNTAATLLGMWVGSKVWPARQDERERSTRFWERLQTPVLAAPVAAVKNGTEPLIAGCTVAVAILLAIAGLVARSTDARIIDFSVAATLACVGLVFNRRR